jgi:broad specificity phosphatase PhoE
MSHRSRGLHSAGDIIQRISRTECYSTEASSPRALEIFYCFRPARQISLRFCPGAAGFIPQTNMHTRIFLVRHGATVLTAEDRFAGATDVELSDEGREQVRRLAVRLGGENIAAIYASPLGRTVETAQILAEPHGLEVQTRDGLREISHGRWEQMTRKEVEQAFPDEAAAWEKDPYTFAPVGGESGLAVTARALPVLMDIVRENAEGNVLIVSHKATIRLLLSSLIGFDPRRYRDTLDQNPAALNIVDFKDAVSARLTLFNDTSHYAAAGLAIPAVPTSRLSKAWDDEKK